MSFVGCGVVALSVSGPGFARDADGMRTWPPDAPLSAQRLERVTDYFNKEVKEG